MKLRRKIFLLKISQIWKLMWNIADGGRTLNVGLTEIDRDHIFPIYPLNRIFQYLKLYFYNILSLIFPVNPLLTNFPSFCTFWPLDFFASLLNLMKTFFEFWLWVKLAVVDLFKSMSPPLVIPQLRHVTWCFKLRKKTSPSFYHKCCFH